MVCLTVWPQLVRPSAPVLFSLVLLLQALQHTADLQMPDKVRQPGFKLYVKPPWGGESLSPAQTSCKRRLRH